MYQAQMVSPSIALTRRWPSSASRSRGIVIEENDRPITFFLWPGKTTDITTLLPVIEGLRSRFGINRACVVEYRGMISTATIAQPEPRGIDYTLGAYERSSKESRETVLNNDGVSVTLIIPRQNGATEWSELTITIWPLSPQPSNVTVTRIIAATFKAPNRIGLAFRRVEICSVRNAATAVPGGARPRKQRRTRATRSLPSRAGEHGEDPRLAPHGPTVAAGPTPIGSGDGLIHAHRRWRR